MMSDLRADDLLLQGARSAELTAVFQGIADTDVDGAPKYLPKDVRELVRVVVCRTYATAILEFCHLVAAVESCGRGRDLYERFFWSPGVARSARYRAYLQTIAARAGWSRAGFALTATGVENGYPDGRFVVSYKRMPFLNALAEFLMTTVGYAEVDRILVAMVADGRAAAVSNAANALSRAVYDYLKDHLPTAQNQRKFRRLTAFLGARRGERFGPYDIDDAAILDFWLDESPGTGDEATDFKTYTSVFKSFVRLIQALDQAARIAGLEAARSIGKDRAGGEIDPDLLGRAAELVDEAVNPLLVLQKEPAAAVKFLNKQETASLESLLETGPLAQRLALSMMRAEVFGKAQARVTQGLRRHLDGAALDALIAGAAEEDYVGRVERYAGLTAHLDRILLASLHALLRAGSRETVGLLLDLRPDLDLTDLIEMLRPPAVAGKVVALRPRAAVERLLELLEDPRQVGAEIAALMAEARKAYRGLARQGFDDDPARPELAAAFEGGVPPLQQLRQALAGFRRRLDEAPPAGAWDRQFDADTAVFSQQFKLLYGAAA